MAKKSLLAMALVLLMTLVGLSAWAAPLYFNYQGRLVDRTSGAPVDGTVNMTFRIYDSDDVSANLLWEEEHTGVAVDNGIYNVHLGSGTTTQGTFDPDLFAEDDRWLEVVVNGEPFAPRQQCTSVAYSLSAVDAVDADTVDGQHASDFAGISHDHSFGEITGTAADAQIPDDITINNAASADYANTADSADYADSAGDADTVDGEHASAFADTVHAHGFSQITGTATDAQIPNNITINYAASAGNADTVDGLHASSFLNTSNDYGRSGVASNLYEGTSTLSNRYINDDWADTMQANTTLNLFSVIQDGTGKAIYAESAGAKGVEGTATGTNGAGVAGYCFATNGSGVFGQGDKRGVYGYVTTSNAYGVHGEATDANSWAGYFSGRLYASGNVGIGTTSPLEKLHVEGDIQIPNNSNIKNANGNAIFHTGWTGQFGDYTDMKSGYSWGSGEPVAVVAGTYGVFFTKGDESGNPHAETLMRVDTNGKLSCPVLEITGGSDLSEQFEIRSPKEDLMPSAGMVVSIDPESPGDLVVSHKAYDRRVAGIISGAGGVRPGMLMGQKGTEADGSNPVALTGRVYCLADASDDPIEPGDLLTTSDTPGHAMKVTDYVRAQGAILGKAMQELKKGQKGEVLVLVTLQ